MESEHILIVDDDEAICDVFSLMLEREYTVFKAYDGNEAMSILDSHHKLIDVLITDVRLSGVSGIDLCHQYVEDNPKGKVIFITGNIVFPGVDDVQYLDNVLLMQKPFTPSELSMAVRSFLDGD